MILDEIWLSFYIAVFKQVIDRDMFKVGIGQDSHRFQISSSNKVCKIGGVEFHDVPAMDADSDGDVLLHAFCNAITSIIHVPLLGGICIEMCKSGITDSKVYVQKGLELFKDYKILHVAFTIEGSRPRLQSRSDEIRKEIATLLMISHHDVGITFTTGDGLTEFGKGTGLMAYCILTAEKKS